MIKSRKIISIIVATALVGTLFTACATTKLQVQSTMSKSIFLTPVKKSLRVIYIDIKNTSGQNLNNLSLVIQEKLKVKGYRLTDNPEQAKYILMANVLFTKAIEDNIFQMAVDINVREKTNQKVYTTINEPTNQQYETNYIEKTSKIFAEATKMGLQLTETLPILEEKMASQIAGIF